MDYASKCNQYNHVNKHQTDADQSITASTSRSACHKECLKRDPQNTTEPYCSLPTKISRNASKQSIINLQLNNSYCTLNEQKPSTVQRKSMFQNATTIHMWLIFKALHMSHFPKYVLTLQSLGLRDQRIGTTVWENNLMTMTNDQT